MSEPTGAGVAGREVLVVEDSRTQAEQLSRHLKAEGHAVSVARDGFEALEIMRARVPSLVITDILMPGMDGYALCKKIKDDPRTREVPVILLTSLGDTEDVIRGLECGADNFITKPYDVAYLIARVQSILLNKGFYSSEKAQMGLEIFFGGKRHFINSDRLQILNLLISTYDNAVRLNGVLMETQNKLRRLNLQLESKVAERTSALLEEIAKHEKAEAALIESEQRYREFFEDDLTAASITAMDGRILDCNPAFVSLFGFASREDALRSDTTGLYPSPENRAQVLEMIRRKGRIENYELELRRADGKPLFVIQNAVGKFDGSGQLIQVKAYTLDITDRKRLEEQFMQAQKMEAVGRLAGGVAHDFNNMLMVIQGFTDFLLRDAPPEDPKRQYLTEVRKATDRAAGLTSQLLAFSRRQVFQLEVFSPNAVIEESVKMIRRLIGEDIELALSLDEGLPQVSADRGQMVQVLMNLAVNARDAMPGGGKITIETRTLETPGELPFTEASVPPDAPSGRHVLVIVRDTGTGMDEGTMRHIFEPFFTTKEHGRGTGLGLATVYGIVKQSGGSIVCESKPGTGTAFHILLPAVTEPAARAREGEAAKSADPSRMRGTETILLAEDDEKVREITQAILAEQGYTVVLASNGRDALEKIRKGDTAIDMVLSDVVMPLMRGLELAREVRILHPGMRFLFMSGYIDQNAEDFETLGRGVHFLQKPVKPPALLAAIRKILEEQV